MRHVEAHLEPQENQQPLSKIMENGSYTKSKRPKMAAECAVVVQSKTDYFSRDGPPVISPNASFFVHTTSNSGSFRRRIISRVSQFWQDGVTNKEDIRPFPSPSYLPTLSPSQSTTHAFAHQSVHPIQARRQGLRVTSSLVHPRPAPSGKHVGRASSRKATDARDKTHAGGRRVRLDVAAF